MRILLVEDDLDYVQSYIAEIEKDYVVDVAYTASDGAYMSEVNDYDLIVADSSLPCKEVRDADVSSPILLLLDKEDASVRVDCLRDGANVCLPKSVDSKELTAQIKALLKLRHRFGNSNKIKIGDIVLDTDSQEVYAHGKKLELRKKEFNILEYLAVNRGHLISKEELLDHIWEDGILVKSNLLEVHIKNLRNKIDAPFGTRVIKTVKGFGYKIE